MDKFSELIGLRIKQIRLCKGLSQEELAHCSNLHTAQVGYIERGEKSCTIATLKKLADGLNISVNEMINIDEPYCEEEIGSDMMLEFQKCIRDFDPQEQLIALDSIKNLAKLKRKLKADKSNDLG